MALNERTALERMFEELQTEKRELKDNYRKDLADLEQRQFNVLDRIKRLDDWERTQYENVLAQPVQAPQLTNEPAIALLNTEAETEAAAATETKKRLGAMKLPKGFIVKRLADHKQKQPEPQPEPERTYKTLADVEAEKATEAPVNEVMAEALSKALENVGTEPGKPKYTGILEGKGEKRYQVYYMCDRCGNKGRRYIVPSIIETFCHECGKTLRVRPATKEGFPHPDENNNFFIAGMRKRKDEYEEIMAAKAAAAEPAAKIDQVLSTYKAEQEEAKRAEPETKTALPRENKRREAKRAAAAAVVHNKKSEPTQQPEDGKSKAAPAAPRKNLKDVLAAIELIIEENGEPMRWQDIEKQVKEQFTWEWANFYTMFTRALDVHPNNIFKDGRKYFVPIKKGGADNGQNSIQQETATI